MARKLIEQQQMDEGLSNGLDTTAAHASVVETTTASAHRSPLMFKTKNQKHTQCNDRGRALFFAIAPLQWDLVCDLTVTGVMQHSDGDLEHDLGGLATTTVVPCRVHQHSAAICRRSPSLLPIQALSGVRGVGDGLICLPYCGCGVGPVAPVAPRTRAGPKRSPLLLPALGAIPGAHEGTIVLSPRGGGGAFSRVLRAAAVTTDGSQRLPHTRRASKPLLMPHLYLLETDRISVNEAFEMLRTSLREHQWGFQLASHVGTYQPYPKWIILFAVV